MNDIQLKEQMIPIIKESIAGGNDIGIRAAINIVSSYQYAMSDNVYRNIIDRLNNLLTNDQQSNSSAEPIG